MFAAEKFGHVITKRGGIHISARAGETTKNTLRDSKRACKVKGATAALSFCLAFFPHVTLTVRVRGSSSEPNAANAIHGEAAVEEKEQVLGTLTLTKDSVPMTRRGTGGYRDNRGSSAR